MNGREMKKFSIPLPFIPLPYHRISLHSFPVRFRQRRLLSDA